LFANGKKISSRIRTGSSYLSQSEKIATFGLGQTKEIDSVEVFWSSGKKSILYDLEVNKEHIIFE